MDSRRRSFGRSVPKLSVPDDSDSSQPLFSPFATTPSKTPELMSSNRRREPSQGGEAREGGLSYRSTESKKRSDKGSSSLKGKEAASPLTTTQKAQAKRQAVTELLFFSSVGSLSDCKRLVKQFEIKISDPTTADYDKRTPLHLAAAEGHIDVVNWLLSKRADLNPIDRFKRTPLEEAVRSDYGSIVSLLIQHKAKVVGPDGNLVDLALSHLSGNVNVIDSNFTPDWAIDSNAITLVKKISDGPHGATYKAKWRGTVVAVKVLKDSEKINLGSLTQELNVIFKVQHPNIVQLLGAVVNVRPYMIVYEFLTGGSILNIFKNGGCFSQWRSLMLAIDLAKGLDNLHDRPVPIVHGDLRPSLLLLGGTRVFNSYHKGMTTDEIGVLKIADFGLSKTLQKSLLTPDTSSDSSKDDDDDNEGFLGLGKQGGSSGRKLQKVGAISLKPAASANLYEEDETIDRSLEDGPLRYIAPELYLKEGFSPAVDIYSFGMIVFLLFECSAPFDNLSPEEAARAASDGKRPEWGAVNRMGQAVPDSIKELVASCCHPNPSFRMNLSEAIRELQEVARKIRPTISERPKDMDDHEDACCSCLG